MEERLVYDCDGVRIYNDDCRLLLADIEADVVITDPVWPTAPAGMFEGLKTLEGYSGRRSTCGASATQRHPREGVIH